MTERGERDGDDGPVLSGPDALGYRRPLPGFSTNDRAASANGARAQRLFGSPGLSGTMDQQPSPVGKPRLPDLDIALKSILAFWLLYWALITLRSIALEYPDFWAMLARRTVAALIGALITFLVYLALRPTRESTLTVKSLVAALLCLPASLMFAGVNYAIFYLYAPLTVAQQDSMAEMGWGPVEMAVRSILDTSLSWYFLFAAWSAFFVAMAYARQLREADRRAGALAREAQEAQLRALRYQINPHFLFNTLNSLSSLILRRDTDVAERMLMNLSTFFRATLSADPTADVRLEEEIALQRLYLDIERIRFPDRLSVRIDVPAELGRALVPVLILQPVVENAVKYGVARSRKPVTVSIAAEAADGRLSILVHDDGEAPPPAPADDEDEEDEGNGTSTGVGLRNVTERLEARFGARGGVTHGPDPQGGYTVQLFMPMVRDG